jgi:periplasmic copper chaperone A
MRLENSILFHAVAIGVLLLVLMAAQASAHVTLAEPQGLPAAQYVGHFRVGHGCDGSPTVRLRIELPPEVTDVTPEPLQGWTVATEREGSRIKAVTWNGGILPSDQRGLFTIAMTLPSREGQLLFPARQTCQAGEEYWSEPPPQTGKAKYPAPILLVASAPPSTAKVTVTDGWFRTLPASVPSGGYFNMRNDGENTLTLTGAESPACGMLMMHKSSNGGMEHVMSLEIAAGETVRFAPGGYHLMCMDTKPVLKPGAQIPVTFRFTSGQVVTANFQARNAAGK